MFVRPMSLLAAAVVLTAASPTAVAAAPSNWSMPNGWATAHVTDDRKQIKICSNIGADNIYAKTGYAEAEYTTSYAMTYTVRARGYACSSDSTFFSRITAVRVCYGSSGLGGWRSCTGSVRL
jgi:outer membrane protein W